jgi:hypothetical protein
MLIHEIHQSLRIIRINLAGTAATWIAGEELESIRSYR